MATLRQKKMAKKLLESVSKDGKPETLQKIMLDSGYSKTASVAPSRVINSKGVIKIFEKAGISANSIAEQWNLIIKAKPKEKEITWDAKIKALTQLNKIFGLETRDAELNPKIQFIDKFLNLQMLKQNRPKTITTKE